MWKVSFHDQGNDPHKRKCDGIEADSDEEDDEDEDESDEDDDDEENYVEMEFIGDDDVFEVVYL